MSDSKEVAWQRPEYGQLALEGITRAAMGF